MQTLELEFGLSILDTLHKNPDVHKVCFASMPLNILQDIISAHVFFVRFKRENFIQHVALLSQNWTSNFRIFRHQSYIDNFNIFLFLLFQFIAILWQIRIGRKHELKPMDFFEISEMFSFWKFTPSIELLYIILVSIFKRSLSEIGFLIANPFILICQAGSRRNFVLCVLSHTRLLTLSSFIFLWQICFLPLLFKISIRCARITSEAHFIIYIWFFEK